MKEPVIVNSLLTFVHNFREHPAIVRLINDFFAKGTVMEAHSLLLKYIGECNGMPGDLLSAYDELASKEQLPRFAAEDLTILPMVLLGVENDKNDLLREMRQLRRYIHDAFCGKIDEPLPQTRMADSNDTPLYREKLQTSASSPEFPTNEKAASNLNGAELREQKPSLTSAPTSPASPEDRLSNNSRNSQQLKRKNTKSLDAAVKKLTDRQSKTACRENNSFPATEWHPRSTQANLHIDPQAYINMIRLMHQPPQTSLFPVAQTWPLEQIHKSPPASNESVSDDHEFTVKSEKNYDEDSPSPSEDLKYDFDSSGEDKRFICEHNNCQKRFANKFLLKKHQFIHTGLRPHTCPFCSKRFNRKDNLLRHKKTHLQNGHTLENMRDNSLLSEASVGGVEHIMID